MADLSCTFLGLPIKNPFIIASSGLTSTKEGIQKAVKANAGAIVLKSLFEEQLRGDVAALSSDSEPHPELGAYFTGNAIMAATAIELDLVKTAKSETDIPIIASINGSGESIWKDFAAQLESVGADAIELNLGYVPISTDITASQIEDKLVSLVAAVTKTVKIPVCAKIGSTYTNVGNLVTRLVKAGAKGVTMFNHFYRMDVDLDAKNIKAAPMKSNADLYYESLRWISLLEGRVSGIDLAASGGVYDALTALKLISVGANAVQVCSLLYAKGYTALPKLIEDTSSWMDAHNIQNLNQLRGTMSRRNSENPELYGRIHYVKALTGQF